MEPSDTYYEASKGPFLNLSHLPLEGAQDILSEIRRAGRVFAGKRSANYLQIRRELEDRVRQVFIAKSGEPRPHYLILGACPWMVEWYTEGDSLRILLTRFKPEVVSFTYGDTFPAMHYPDGRPYRGQAYTLPELPKLIRCYGLPQVSNRDGSKGPDRYIEAQLWDDEPIKQFLPNHRLGPTD